ncbi:MULTISPECIES: DUF421 domain-containing protein [Clostridiaceae]|uniref:DUF421 domain-containing protein n=1 Tax=Clostridium facile TaxID=2763035 RepID=A0ABR7IQM6_9CLOT|nr:MULTISPECIES: DUF421 domain-containing protein [Clostridiaceae]MBC5787427.1 DUF421 domain-containing protein [Clostridium facile]
MLIVMIRAILLYILIIFCMRFMGKRQIGELQPGELVITMMISNMAILPIEDTNIPMLAGAVPILILVCFEIILSVFTLRWKKLRKFISGSPVVIIENGVLKQQELKKLRFSIDDLMEGLRSKDIFNVSEVLYALVETNGKISVVKKGASQTITANMLNLEVQEEIPPTIVISDGILVKENIEKYHIDPNWINEILKKKHLSQKDVFIMTTTPQQTYQIIRKEAIS